MGVRIIAGDEVACLYCSTTDTAFGPIFYGDDKPDGHSAWDRADAFTDWLPLDARKYTDSELKAKFHEFVTAEPEYWAAREREAEAKYNLERLLE